MVRPETGASTTVVEVEETAVAINAEQAIIQGVLNSQQIDQLPISGRNFLDLAQLEPGVQIQDGTSFDPTRVGYSSISFGGRFGRTARISEDGVEYLGRDRGHHDAGRRFQRYSGVADQPVESRSV